MQAANQIIGLIDLTSLNNDDTETTIEQLCNKSITPCGNVAAICVFSHLVPYARKCLTKSGAQIKIATVVNFPGGLPDIDLAMQETVLALERGADEIDLVCPYHALMQNNDVIYSNMIAAVKKLCGNKVLKLIIESGMLASTKLIATSCKIGIDNGADFIKTSTGKVATNATLEAAEIILNCIKASGSDCGFKASGGIKTAKVANDYIQLAAKIMGHTWINSKHFRFGASALLDDVLSCNLAY